MEKKILISDFWENAITPTDEIKALKHIINEEGSVYQQILVQDIESTISSNKRRLSKINHRSLTSTGITTSLFSK